MVSERFLGIERLYGTGSVAILAKAHVLVVGIGGVGSWAAEALARSGVGSLTLLDGDDVCISNTNRQLHALDGAFGKPKVQVMGDRLRTISPDLQVFSAQEFLTPQNLEAHLSHAYDFVFDACDALRTKVAMVAYCKRNKIPIIVCGSAGGRTDPSLMRIRDLSKTEHDAMLSLIRRKLRDDYGWTKNPKRYFGVPAIYSMENVRYPTTDACANTDGNVTDTFKLDCGNGLGSACHVTATMAFVGVTEVIRRMLLPKVIS